MRSILIFSVLLLLASSAGCDADKKKQQIDQYFAQLDAWVEKGAPVDEIQADVVDPCGKMLIVYSPVKDIVRFVTTGGDDIDFWVDMCVKMTAHRISPQPEFEGAGKAELLSQTCDSHEMWRRLCDRAELDQ